MRRGLIIMHGLNLHPVQMSDSLPVCILNNGTINITSKIQVKRISLSFNEVAREEIQLQRSAKNNSRNVLAL